MNTLYIVVYIINTVIYLLLILLLLLYLIFVFSEQLQILKQFIQHFNDIVEKKIDYLLLSDTEKDKHSYMVI